MDKVHNVISRKNVYGITLFILVVVVLVSVLFPKLRDNMHTVVFNPFWPTIIPLFEIYIQTKEKENARKNERKIDALSGVLRMGINNRKERKIIKSILDAIREEDLIAYSNSLIESEELNKQVGRAGEISGISLGVNPD